MKHSQARPPSSLNVCVCACVVRIAGGGEEWLGSEQAAPHISTMVLFHV